MASKHLTPESHHITMKVVLIHGQERKGSTYTISHKVAEKISFEDDITEFFMPKDGPEYCKGCNFCFFEGEDKCPSYEKIKLIVAAMLECDIIVIDSPNRCMGMTGQLKTMFDHIGYLWMAHRPEPGFFSKSAIVISTTSGRGSKNVCKDITEQLKFIGVPNTYSIPLTVGAGLDTLPQKNIEKLDLKIDKIVDKAIKKAGKVKPSMFQKFFFSIVRKYKIKPDSEPALDREYWEHKGWLSDSRPWK